MRLKSRGPYTSHMMRKQAVARHCLAVQWCCQSSKSLLPFHAAMLVLLLNTWWSKDDYSNLRHHICIQGKRRGRTSSKSICSWAQESKGYSKTLASRSPFSSHWPESSYVIARFKRAWKTKNLARRTYISIITLNVNRLNALTKRHRLAEWTQKQDPYICCVQKPTSDIK